MNIKIKEILHRLNDNKFKEEAHLYDMLCHLTDGVGNKIFPFNPLHKTLNIYAIISLRKVYFDETIKKILSDDIYSIELSKSKDFYILIINETHCKLFETKESLDKAFSDIESA